ncbi:MAG: FAD-dependent oxidoreductase [Phyllobacteriaceae bacterium]|nr:FAD-dependent oxidoreductase [Phyllobacteriaceae bacterium]
MNETRLWGWLSPDQPDPLAGKAKAEAMIASALGLEKLARTPPVPLDPATVPASRLSAAQMDALRAAVATDTVSLDPARRAAALLGQSYPDQLARRAGRVARAADAVVEPSNAGQVAAILAAARGSGFRVMASGGGTNVVGAFLAAEDQRPLVALSLARMAEVMAIEPRDRTVTAQSGIKLPALEQRLSAAGLTLDISRRASKPQRLADRSPPTEPASVPTPMAASPRTSFRPASRHRPESGRPKRSVTARPDLGSAAWSPDRKVCSASSPMRRCASTPGHR